jgi:hypothetical protein
MALVPNMVNLLLTYQFIKKLVTPFEDWDAYKLGIIDKKGNTLKRKVSLSTPEQRKSWTHLDILAANLKKLFTKYPGLESKLISKAALGQLVREEREWTEEEILLLVKNIEEEMANVVGDGKVAGLGVGDQGEPPSKRKTKIIKRKPIDVGLKLHT